MTTEQIDVPIEPLQINPGPLSDIEDGEIPNLENHSSPTLNKKAKKKSKSKKLSVKRKELENIDFNSSNSEKINSDNDSDDGWWSKKKRHLNDLKAARYHEEVEGEDIIIEESLSGSYSNGKFDKNFQRRDSFSKEKSYHGKNSKFKDEKDSVDSGDENDKDAQRYPCKAYIAYGKCTDPDCRCVHAPLTRESEIKRFIDENEDYFHEVFKKFPGITIPPPLLKALTEKFGPPPSPPVVNPNSSPQGHLLRPMPPPKFFPPQNHFPGPVSPTPTPPVFGFPPQPQPGHPFPNMFTPGGVHPPQASPQGFPIQPMPQMSQAMFPGQQPMQPVQPMFNGMNGMSPVASLMNHGFGMMNNMSPVRSPMGFPQMNFGMYPGNMGVGFPGANMNMMNSTNFEAKQIDIKIKSPEKKSPSRNKDSKHKSPEGTNSSKSSPSSTAKEISEELARLSKRKSTEKMTGIEKNVSSSSGDIQSMETDSATPESKSKEELRRAKNDSTAEKIARLVELFKAKKQKEAEVTPNKEAEENIQPQESPIMKKDVVTTPVPVVENHIPKQEPKVLDARNEAENEDEVKENKVMNNMEEEKPVVENVKEDEKPVVEIKEKEEGVKKSIFENISTNELLLRQLKSALPLNQGQSAGNIKDLVNMYLKLGKKPGF